MDRRDLLKMIAAATGAALVGGPAMAAFGTGTGGGFDGEALRLLDEVTETLLPRTDTPGAKDARVAGFIDVFVRDCYTAEDQALFRDGLAQIDARSRKLHGAGFLALDAARRDELIATLDRDARSRLQAGEGLSGFTLIKQLTLLGFFTSEAGATEVLRYVAVPGYYDGSVPYEPGQRAWAT